MKNIILFTILSIMPLWAIGQNISFQDEYVKRKCVANWDKNGDGELSRGEAAAVTDLGHVFEEQPRLANRGWP